jgi:D-alanyl-D-alanine carboxypeptidase
MMSKIFSGSAIRRAVAIAVALAITASSAFAQALPGALRSRVDNAVNAILAASGAPSASIAIVRDGSLAYEKTYGMARSPGTPARPSMRYSIGSVSKQFTAAAVLLLAEDGKVSLEDKVAKWLPELTGANLVSVRQLLTMTAGYQDYWPQDYVFPAMMSPTTPRDVLAQWAQKPLDFEPGTKWQYSNTNYVIAGLIVERVSGMPLMEFLQRRIFTPLQMTSARNVDSGPLENSDAGAYLRNALGPLRPAPKEAKGWLFGAADLGMTAHDLALWDISIINRTLLKPESYQTMVTAAKLSNNSTTGYGMGFFLGSNGGHKSIEHDGAVSGYLTANVIYPDDKAAIVSFANIYPGAASPHSDIAEAIAGIIFDTATAEDTKVTDLTRRVFLALQRGQIDRTLFTENANAYFSAQTLSEFASSLGPIGVPAEFNRTAEIPRGGMVFHIFRVLCGRTMLEVSVAILPDGRIEQYIVAKAG